MDMKQITPATKEQSELLFKALKTAGYTWIPDRHVVAADK